MVPYLAEHVFLVLVGLEMQMAKSIMDKCKCIVKHGYYSLKMCQVPFPFVVINIIG